MTPWTRRSFWVGGGGWGGFGGENLRDGAVQGAETHQDDSWGLHNADKLFTSTRLEY